MNFKITLLSVLTAALTWGTWGTYVTAGNTKAGFIDIDQHWGKAAILSAAASGLVDGYEDGSFRPEQNVSRAEFVKMAATALKLNVGAVEQGAGWYKAYVKALTDAGIVREGDFAAGDMNKPISRLEMSRIAVRSTDAELQKKAVHIDDLSVMFHAAKSGLIQGLAYGELAVDGLTTRAQSVTIIDRMLKKNAGETLPVDKYAASNAEIALRGTNFETMYGKKSALTLPIQHNLTADVKMTIKQVMFYDSSDPASPVWRLLGNAERPDNESLENSYYFVYKIEYDMGNQPRDYAIRVADYLKNAGWIPVYSPTLADRIMRYEVGKKEGYMIYVLSKVDSEKQYKSVSNTYYSIEGKSYNLFVH